MNFRITLGFILLTFVSNLYSQIVPYVPVEFIDFTPVWRHVSIDSTLMDGDKYDGMTHFAFFEDHPIPYIIDENNLYITYNTYVRSRFEVEGGFIEKLDLSTGKSLWANHFDLRNNDRFEYIESIYKNDIGNLEVVTDRRIRGGVGSDPGHIDFGDTSLICIRNYAINTGELISHEYPDPTDSLSLRIRYTTDNRRLLFPLRNNEFLYTKYGGYEIENFIIDEKGHLLAEPTRDTVDFDKPFIRDSVISPTQYKMERISKDTLIVLNYLLDRKDFTNTDFDKQTKLTIYDEDMKERNVLKIDSFLPERFVSLSLMKADKKFIYLGARYQKYFNKRDTFFFQIYDWEGNLLRKFDEVVDNKHIHIYGKTAFYSEIENEFIVVASSDVVSDLRFYIIESNDSLRLLKEIKFEANGRYFIPNFICQLENGDILIRGDNRLLSGEYKYYKQWKTWMRFKAEDLGLKPVSTTQREIYNKIKLFPNPAKDKINIELNQNINGVIKIYDVIGRELFSDVFIGKEKSIETDNLSEGIQYNHIIKWKEDKNNAVCEGINSR